MYINKYGGLLNLCSITNLLCHVYLNLIAHNYDMYIPFLSIIIAVLSVHCQFYLFFKIYGITIIFVSIVSSNFIYILYVFLHVLSFHVVQCIAGYYFAWLR